MGKSSGRFWRPDWWHGVAALVLGLLGTIGVLWLFHLTVTEFHLLAGWLATLNPGSSDKPVWIVTISSSFQPLNRKRSQPCFPLKKGRSYMIAAKRIRLALGHF